MQVNWNELGGGYKFQSLCREILKNAGYRVEERAAGGSDDGRDLSILTAFHNIIDFRREEIFWIECKFTEAATISVRSVRQSIWFAVPETVNGIALFTNATLSNQARDVLRVFNTSRFGQLTQIGYLNGDDLSDIILAEPTRYIDFFPSLLGRGPRPLPEATVVRVGLQTDARFEDDVETAILKICNRSDQPQDVFVNIPGRTNERLRLMPYETAFRSMGRRDVPPQKWDKVSITSAAGAAFTIDGNKPKDRGVCRRIDAIFVDAFDVKSQAQAILSSGNSLFISGNPGGGKSRLLQEIIRQGAWSAIRVDLSQGDYRHSLADHLIAAFLGTPVASLIEFEEAMAACNKIPGMPADNWNAIRRILRGNPEAADSGKLADGMSAFLLTEITKGAKLVIDNVHALTASDSRLLERLLWDLPPGGVVLTARNGQDLEPRVAELLSEAMRERMLQILDLSDFDVRSFVDRHLEQCFPDEKARSWMAKFRQFTSIQEYMLFLKMLRSRSLIRQNDNGNLHLVQDLAGSAHETYLGLVEDLVAPLRNNHGNAIDEVLDLIAAAGFTIPIEVLLRALPDCEEALEALLKAELLTENASGMEISFDHEITRNAVYQRHVGFVRRRYHQALFGALADSRAGTREGLMKAEHAEQALLLLEAFNAYVAQGVAWEKQYRVRDSLDAYAAAYRVHEALSRDDKDTPHLQLRQLLIGLAHTRATVDGALAARNAARELDVYAFEHGDDEAAAIAGIHIGKAFEAELDGLRALQYLDRAITKLRASENSVVMGRALAARGNVLKKCFSDYSGALTNLRTALHLLDRNTLTPERANAVGLVGGTLIEAGRERKALYWYRKAVHLAREVGDIDLLCFRQIAYAFLVALVVPESPDAEHELELAVSLARRTGSSERLVRARLNLANWQMFHSSDQDIAKRTLDECATICENKNYAYLSLCSDFSRWMLQCLSNKNWDDGDPYKLFERLLQFKPDILIDDRLLDARTYNILRFLVSCGHSAAIEAITASSCSRIRALVTQEMPYDFRAFERDSLFVTYF